MKRTVLFTITTALTLSAGLPAFANPLSPSARDADDPRAMCSDVLIGNNVKNHIVEQTNVQEKTDIHKYNQKDIRKTARTAKWDNSTYERSTRKGGGRGNVKVLWGLVSAGGGGDKTTTNLSKTANAGENTFNNYQDRSRSGFRDRSTFSDTSRFEDFSTSTVVAGQNCDAVVQAEAAKQINRQNNNSAAAGHFLSW
ncbi:hypothetical protein C1752_02701 [Acaryochloris thomasi RCC1774]|uniref:Secreted protein n=1 Tax=Acaryochloris thomasi RCC1774 TaxID=1764569 RepID=A0A2W1JIE0_9CYAN|nr:hypothetical protein [Acaryochloris thomasi]PZD73066.1 hypothetical protein C1752_02701 [Acaryochloris thomasi RCC1774]